VVLVSAREPLDQYATLPPAPPPPGTSVHPFHAAPISLLFLSFSLSLFLSAVSAPLAPICSGHPSTTWPTCSPTPEERDDTTTVVETGFRAGRRFGGGNTPLSRIFRHALALLAVLKKKGEEGESSRHSREYPRRKRGDVFSAEFNASRFSAEKSRTRM